MERRFQPTPFPISVESLYHDTQTPNLSNIGNIIFMLYNYCGILVGGGRGGGQACGKHFFILWKEGLACCKPLFR